MPARSVVPCAVVCLLGSGEQARISRDLRSARKGERAADSHGPSVRTLSEGGPPLAWGPQTLPLKGDPTFYIAGGELRSFKPFFLLERRVWHDCLGSTGQASWGAQGWCQVCRTPRQPGQCRLKPDFHSKGDPSAGKRLCPPMLRACLVEFWVSRQQDWVSWRRWQVLSA